MGEEGRMRAVREGGVVGWVIAEGNGCLRLWEIHEVDLVT